MFNLLIFSNQNHTLQNLTKKSLTKKNVTKKKLTDNEKILYITGGFIVLIFFLIPVMIYLAIQNRDLKAKIKNTENKKELNVDYYNDKESIHTDPFDFLSTHCCTEDCPTNLQIIQCENIAFSIENSYTKPVIKQTQETLSFLITNENNFSIKHSYKKPHKVKKALKKGNRRNAVLKCNASINQYNKKNTSLIYQNKEKEIFFKKEIKNQENKIIELVKSNEELNFTIRDLNEQIKNQEIDLQKLIENRNDEKLMINKETEEQLNKISALELKITRDFKIYKQLEESYKALVKAIDKQNNLKKKKKYFKIQSNYKNLVLSQISELENQVTALTNKNKELEDIANKSLTLACKYEKFLQSDMLSGEEFIKIFINNKNNNENNNNENNNKDNTYISTILQKIKQKFEEIQYSEAE